MTIRSLAAWRVCGVMHLSRRRLGGNRLPLRDLNTWVFEMSAILLIAFGFDSGFISLRR